MLIHIGQIIKEAVKKKGISVTDFADRINYSRRNVYEIFDRETIDTSLLVKINKVLEQNFFVLYLSKEDIKNLKASQTPPQQLEELLIEFKAEVKKLKELNTTAKKTTKAKKPKARKKASN